MYRILRPLYEKTGESSMVTIGGRDIPVQWERVVQWIPVGYARDAKEAREKFAPVQFGYALVMEEA